MAPEVTISDVLAPALRAAFPSREIRYAAPPDPVATVPPTCAELGAVSVLDEGDEATVVIENITHCHFSPDDPMMSQSDSAQWITAVVVEFLQELFADQVLLWSVDRGWRGGGWIRPFEGEIPNSVPLEADVFVWSKRLRKPGESHTAR